MNRMTGTFVAMLVCAFLAVVVFFLIDLSGEKTFATPQEAFDAARAALQKNDMRGFCECLTSESRDLLAASVIVQEFVKKQGDEKDGTEEQKEHIRNADKVFAQHGLTEEFLTKMQKEALTISHPQAPMEAKLESARDVLAPVRDPNGLIADMFQAAMKGSKAENPFSVLKDAKLSNVNITGKTAVGGISGPGQERPSPMSFRKQGEGWRIDLFAEEKRGMPGGMPGMPPGHP